jgi:dihydrofolate reductase
MSKVVFDISMSLDGFMTASNRTAEEPMGNGGLRLVEWAMGADQRNREYLQSAIKDLGAVITGRVTYDTSVPWWKADGPSGPDRRPVFVVTHEKPALSPDGGVYTFVTDGIDSALRQAKAAADGRIVTVMGGADIGRQYLAAGLVDEISIHLIPVLFGSGTPMFEQLDIGHVELEPLETAETPQATHLRFRVRKSTP